MQQSNVQQSNVQQSNVKIVIRHINCILIIAVLPLILSGCGKKDSEDSTAKIFVGSPIGAAEFPSVIQLTVYKQYLNQKVIGYKCSSVAISSTSILTAAHCFNTIKNEKITAISAAGYRISGQAVDQAVLVNPFYQRDLKTTAADLAIVQFPGNYFAQTSVIAPGAAKVGSPVTLVGFGNGENNTIRKREGHNTIADNDDGLIFVSGDNDQSYTGGGDSGGPLFYEEQVVGIVSSGREKKQESFYVDLQNASSLKFMKMSYLAGKVDLPYTCCRCGKKTLKEKGTIWDATIKEAFDAHNLVVGQANQPAYCDLLHEKKMGVWPTEPDFEADENRYHLYETCVQAEASECS